MSRNNPNQQNNNSTTNSSNTGGGLGKMFGGSSIFGDSGGRNNIGRGSSNSEGFERWANMMSGEEDEGIDFSKYHTKSQNGEEPKRRSSFTDADSGGDTANESVDGPNPGSMGGSEKPVRRKSWLGNLMGSNETSVEGCEIDWKDEDGDLTTGREETKKKSWLEAKEETEERQRRKQVGVDQIMEGGEKNLKLLGLTEEEVRRETALKRLGVSGEEVEEVNRVRKLMMVGEGGDKGMEVLGVGEEEMSRKKALDVLGGEEKGVEEEAEKEFEKIVRDHVKRSSSQTSEGGDEEGVKRRRSMSDFIADDFDKFSAMIALATDEDEDEEDQQTSKTPPPNFDSDSTTTTTTKPPARRRSWLGKVMSSREVEEDVCEINWEDVDDNDPAKKTWLEAKEETEERQRRRQAELEVILNQSESDKNSKLLGVTEEEVRRETALKRLGVSGEEVEEVNRVRKLMMVGEGGDKGMEVLGVGEEEMSRKKALDVLGGEEKGVEEEAEKEFEKIVRDQTELSRQRSEEDMTGEGTNQK